MLPRLFVGALTALRTRTPVTKLHFTGGALVNFEQTFNLSQYDHARALGASAAEADLDAQARKVAWRLIYYAQLGFDVDGSVRDIKDILHEALEARSSEGEEAAEEAGDEEGDEKDDEEDDEDDDEEASDEYLSLSDMYVDYQGELVELCARWKRDLHIECAPPLKRGSLAPPPTL